MFDGLIENADIVVLNSSVAKEPTLGSVQTIRDPAEDKLGAY